MEKVNILVVTDAQVDFHNGALGTKEAQASVPAIVKKSKHPETRDILFMQPKTPITTIISKQWRERICRFHTQSSNSQDGILFLRLRRSCSHTIRS